MISILLLLSQFAFSAQNAHHFQTGCYQVGDDTLSSSLVMTDQTWTQVHTAFEDEACKTPYLIYSTTYATNIKTTDQANTSVPVDLAVTEVTYTLLSDQVARALNMSGYCGFSDWAPNKAKVVTGLLCDDYQVPKLKSILYSIYDLEAGAHGQQLRLGEKTDAVDGSSPQQRYKTLSDLYYYDSSN